MKPEHGFADVNGARLYYEVAGSGPPLVLLHGSFLDTRMWDDQIEVLAEQCRTIRYDARGHGRSAPPSGQPYARSDDLKALLEFLEVGHASLLGLSMGGGVAVNFAVTYPKSADALILVDVGVAGFPMSAEYVGWIDGIRSLHGGSGGIQPDRARVSCEHRALGRRADRSPRGLPPQAA